MKKHTEYLGVIVLILLSISLNLYFLLNSNSVENIETFHIKRQIESIQKTGLPLYTDNLSYSGRETVFSPGYYYILSFVNMIIPYNLTFNIIAVLFTSLIILIIYLITKKLTNNIEAAFFTSFLSIFIPIYNLKTINSISPYTIIIPLIFGCLYLFSEIDSTKKNTLLWFVLTLIILSFTTANVFILILSLITYIIILRLENIKLNKTKKEIIIFSVFLVIWSQFLIYKKALLMHGPSIVWQNIPLQLILNYFSDINILKIIYYVGIVPFFCGLYIIYKYTFKTKNEDLYLYISLVSVSSFLLVFRLIEIEIGLIYLGFCFVIFFGMFYKNLLTYINKTKFNKYKNYIIALIIIIFFFTSILPSITLLEKKQIEEQVTPQTIEALLWLKENTPEESIILGTISEGTLIAYISNRKNIIDRNFLMVKDINDRINDIKIIYTSSSLIRAIELLDYYNINYIYLDLAKKEYDIEEIRYANSECIDLVYDKDIKIYQVLCRVETYDY
jgi:hypothetical protein